MCPRIKLVWSDTAYRGALVEWARRQCGWRVETVAKADDQQGFVVLPRRWAVEWTFDWLGRNCLLAKDYEELAETTEPWVYLATVRVLLRRRVAS
jgi:putative transposase